MSFDSATPDDFLNKVHNVVLTTQGQIQNVVTSLQITKKGHLLVLSDEPLSSNKEWNVVMQQQFNGHHLILMKKVIYSEVITLRNIYITRELLHFRSEKNQL